jgi:hypothetical protein
MRGAVFDRIPQAVHGKPFFRVNAATCMHFDQTEQIFVQDIWQLDDFHVASNCQYLLFSENHGRRGGREYQRIEAVWPKVLKTQHQRIVHVRGQQLRYSSSR